MELIINIFIYNAIAIVTLLATIIRNPRYVMHDYPVEIIDDADVQTESEKRSGVIWGLPFIINMFAYPLIYGIISSIDGKIGFTQMWGNLFVLLFSFNLVDLILIDWLIFCTWTPSFLILEGTDGHRGYKNYKFHFVAFLKGTVIVLASSVFLTAIVQFLVSI